MGKEPDGSAQTLWGNMVGRMGDRVERARPEPSRKGSSKRTNGDTSEMVDYKKRRGDIHTVGGVESVLDVDAAWGSYRPRTKETREAYEALLAVLSAQFTDAPADVLRGAADETLAILKNDLSKDPERHKEVNRLLGEVSDERFAQLVALGKLITDFVPEGEQERKGDGDGDGDGALDEDLGVAVEFEDESEEEDEEGLVEEIEEGDEDEEGEEEAGNEAGKVRAEHADVDDGVREGKDGSASEDIPVQDIDAYWLQRHITRAFGSSLEPTQAQALAEKVAAALESQDLREAENSLVALLDFDRFDLIKVLIRNRWRIVWCQRLARAQNDEERAGIEATMESMPETAAILNALRATRASARDRQSAMERSIREEARRLRQEGDGSGGPAPQQSSRGERERETRDSGGRRMVDLEALKFAGGGHFNSSKSTTLPQGSYRTVHKGYEEVHVPAPTPPPFGEGEKLRSISTLPPWARPGFKGMKSLNRIQSRVYDCALFGADNMLVCAPTGAGKTNVAMLTMLHEIGLRVKEPSGSEKISVDTEAFKMIYVAPMKALVAEMVGNFSKRLEPYGIKVRELTGDVSLSATEIAEAQLIVVTPEKWDIITRKASERPYTQLVRLIIIDEIHLLHDERGPVLESLVARTLRQVERTQEQVRLVGLSATLPNYEDVATLLRVDPKKGLFYFDNSFRPCPLAQQYVGVTAKKPLERFKAMNEICYSKVIEAAENQGHQVLVFVHSRKETAKTARYLKEEAMRNETLARLTKDDSASREILQTEAEGVKTADLRDLLPFGFGIHHAGMPRADRTLVEDLFADGHIRVLVSTATLAWGVNLPAHTVIIKGTQVYSPVRSAWTELSPLDVMQMFGRAGRPQYDTYGEGIIITQSSQLQFYLSLFNMQLPIESQYVGSLADNLNAEIVLESVQSIDDAVAWLGYTYLNVRMMCNPPLYGVPLDAIDSDPLLKERRADLCHSAAVLLDRHGLIKYDRRSGALRPTELGRIASHYYVSYATIAAFNDYLKPTMGEIELLRLFTKADEFRYVVVRQEEKMELASLIDRVPIPVKELLDDPSAKVNVLLQAYISRLKLEGLALSADMAYVTQSAGRLMSCLYQVCLRRGWASLADRALTLSKCVQQRMWASQSPLRQFRVVPSEVLIRVERKELPWERWYDLSAQDIGQLLRLPKMGKTLHRLIHQFPRVELAAAVQPITRSLVRIDLTITPDFMWDEKIHGISREPFVIIVEDADSENVLHHEPFTLSKNRVESGDDVFVSFVLPIAEPLPPQYFVRIISERWIGAETMLPVSFRHLILPTPPTSPTELLDLRPLSLTALQDTEYQRLYDNRFTVFNPIQTQAFNSVYNNDGNVLVAAPAGSGKTVVAELGILRALRRSGPSTKCVYIAPSQGTVDEKEEDWRARFGGVLGMNIVRLHGDPKGDLDALNSHQGPLLVLTTPREWDALSRRWRQRKAVQGVSLVILDDLHLIGSKEGPVMEIVASRTRYMASQLDSGHSRIIGLSSSLANARDLADWLGVAANSCFNFAPSTRPVPLEIHVRGVRHADADTSSLARVAYQAIVRGGRMDHQESAIVFVPNRRDAKATALDLLTQAAADGFPTRFRLAAEEDVAAVLEEAHASRAGRSMNKSLMHSLSYGVGFIHEGQSTAEVAVVRRLYDAGAIQVLVATAKSVWSLWTECCARLVVIMGTFKGWDNADDGASGGGDLPVTDVLQMVGRAGRQGRDTSSTCLLLCHAPRKRYYSKFLFEALPVESHLDAALHDAFAAEIVSKTIRTKQDAVDYITWTLYYRRLTQNPNYYAMTGVSHRHVSDHLSELVETTLSDLESSKMVAIEDEFDLEPLNLAMIAAYYYVSYATIELFAASLHSKTKLKGLLGALAAASEYDDIVVRRGEERTVEKLLAHAPVAVDGISKIDTHAKVNALIQAHVSRTHLSLDLAADGAVVIAMAPRLIQAMVDVVSSSGYLTPALAAMELSQAITQAVWPTDPVLLQIPGVDKDVATEAVRNGLETIYDIAEMDEEGRRETLKLTDSELERAAAWLARYPDLGVRHEVMGPVVAGEPATVIVELEREGFASPAVSIAALGPETKSGPAKLRPVNAPRFPSTEKEENWWLVVGHSESNTLLAIKRISLARESRTKLEFIVPETAEGKTMLTLFVMCDSYMGCDQEFEIELDVEQGSGGGEDMDE